MKNEKAMIEEMEQEIFNTCTWRFGKPNDYKEICKDIAEDLIKLNYCKIPEGSVVLSKKEYEELKNESAAIAKDYQEMAKFYDEKCEELEEQRDRQAYIAEDLIQEKHRWTEQTREEMAREIVAFIESLKVKEDGRHQWREDHNDCIDKVILKINQKFINSVEVEE